MPEIFICYRRDDAAGWAGRLHADLQAGIKHVEIFRDIDDIPPGVKYSAYIANAVGSCDVLIALIGPRWLTAVTEAGTRRLDDPNDLIRLEIATGLKRDIRVIPALVGGAKLPAETDLPEDIRPLVQRQAYELSDHRWSADCQRLMSDLKPLVHARTVPTRLTIAAITIVAALGVGYGLWRTVSGSPTSPAESGGRPRRPPDKASRSLHQPCKAAAQGDRVRRRPAARRQRHRSSREPQVRPAEAVEAYSSSAGPAETAGTSTAAIRKWPSGAATASRRLPRALTRSKGGVRRPFFPSIVSIDAGHTTTVDLGGVLDFKWPGRDCWNVLRDGKEIAFGCGTGKQALGPGSYVVQGRSNPIFLPFTVAIKTGATTTVEIGGIFEFTWPGRDCWNVYRGAQEVAFGCGTGSQALGAGKYTIRPRSNAVFAPFEISIKDGATVKR